MNTFLTIASIFANVISIITVYQFIKRLDKKQIIIYIAVSVAIMYMIVSLTYMLSGIGIDETIHKASQNFVLYLFVPVNVLLFVPYISAKYMQLKENQIKRDSFVKKVEIMLILLIVVAIAEFCYFRNIQTNIENIQEQRNVVLDSGNKQSTN